MPTNTILRIAAAIAVAAVALLALELLHRALLRAGAHMPVARELAERAHRPAQLVVLLGALRVGLRVNGPEGQIRHALEHALLIGIIIAVAWLVVTLLFVVEDAALAKVRTDVRDNRQARKVHTQVRLLRRITAVVVAVVAFGAVLVTYPSARTAGASLLASAGVVGVVSALAAQSLLGNVFAGLQIAFGGALRLEDVVVVENEWGRIEEITLTHVVVHVWDDRRLIMPTSYFTARPFENWTRTESALLGTVEMDLDWTVPAAAMREELRRLLENSDLWDGRVCVLQVTDAVGGLVRVRALVSAQDAPALWDLRCLVREGLVAWVRDRHAAALPRWRREQVGTRPARIRIHAKPFEDRSDALLFSGDAEALQRADIFAGPRGDRVAVVTTDDGEEYEPASQTAEGRAQQPEEPADDDATERLPRVDGTTEHLPRVDDEAVSTPTPRGDHGRRR
ncbi:MAG TPA: mechanosensitive ion channel domain-containing protein [Micromonosporaceae bacterium]